MKDEFVRLLEEKRGDISRQVTRLTVAEAGPNYRAMGEETLYPLIEQGTFRVFLEDVLADTPHVMYDNAVDLGGTRFRQGFTLEELHYPLTVLRDAIYAAIDQGMADDPQAAIGASRLTASIIDGARLGLNEAYARYREETLAAQQATLLELSTPIVPVWRGILVLPLIGAVDSQRAQRIMEAVLSAISAQGAEVMIIDITGVPVVDTGVANHLLQVVRAAALLGASCVLVGITPEVAQTMVQLGIDLSEIVTRSRLQDGIEFAMKRMNLHIGTGPE